MINMFEMFTFMICCMLLFAACERNNAAGCHPSSRAYLKTLNEYVAATRSGNFSESKRLFRRLSDLQNEVNLEDAEKIIPMIEEAFMSLPLEAGDPSGDWELYHGSCQMAELTMEGIWRLTNSPDRVIDFICLQRRRYDEMAKDSACRYREAQQLVNDDVPSTRELVRLHNLNCNYSHSITIEDESTLMVVISNKFFSSDRKEFDASMDRLKKALGRNLGFDEQLRLLHPGVVKGK